MKNKSRLLGFAAPLIAAASLSAADLNPPFESLPSETIFAFRFDNSSETLAQYAETTRIGQLMLSEEKIAEYKAVVAELLESTDAEDAFLSGLGELGLELDDLYEMLASKIGAAVIEQEVPGHRAMPTFLVWAEMREGMAERAYQAVLEGSLESEDIERIDLGLPGGPGARIRNVSDGSSFLISRLENRFMFAIGNVMEPITSAEDAVVFEEAELEALGRFMSAQRDDGAGFTSAFFSDPGIASVRPDHFTRIEVLGDIAKMLEYAPAESMQAISMLDLDKFTKFGLWSGLVGMEEKSVAFLGAPAPREGLAKLFENEVILFSPPAWVPSSVNSYSVGSFDMNKLYDFFLDVAKKLAPPEQVEQQVAMANGQMQMMLQADIPTLLSAFGKKVHVLEYPIEIASIDLPDGTSLEVPRSSQVLVMDFTRPEILQAGMAMISAQAQVPGSNMEIVEEQGFSGIRMQSPEQGEITIAHGKGKLVLAVGSDETSSKIFSALSHLPQGEEALANSPEMRAFLAENSILPSIGYTFSRGDEVLKNIIPALRSLSGTLRISSGESAGQLMDSLLEVLPSEEEMDGLLGIAFSRIYYNEGGFVFEGTSEYK